MTITFYSTWNEPCGIAGYTADLKRALDTRTQLRTEVIRLPKAEIQFATETRIREILKALAEQASAVAHIQHEFSFFGQTYASSCVNFSFFLKNLKSKKIVITFHSLPIKNDSTVEKIRLAVRRRFGALFNKTKEQRAWNLVVRTINSLKVICIVHDDRSALQLVNSGISESLIKVVPLGVNEMLTPSLSREEAKSLLGYKPDDVLVGLFGFVAAYKGPDIACDAIAALPPNFKLAIVGGRHPENQSDGAMSLIASKIFGNFGRENARKRRQSAALGIDATKSESIASGKVRLTGYLPRADIDIYRTACDIFVAPYREVNLSSSAAITWALSSRRPLIASGVDAFLDIARKYNCMMVIGQEQPSELAWAILKLNSDKALQEDLLREAERYCTDRSWNSVAARYAELYGQTTSRTTGKSAPSGLFISGTAS